jgi:hypothetical protein
MSYFTGFDAERTIKELFHEQGWLYQWNPQQERDLVHYLRQEEVWTKDALKNLSWGLPTLDHLLDVLAGIDVVIEYRGERIGVDVTTNLDAIPLKLDKIQQRQKIYERVGLPRVVILNYGLRGTLDHLNDLEKNKLLNTLESELKSRKPVIHLCEPKRKGYLLVDTAGGVQWVKDYTNLRIGSLVGVRYVGSSDGKGAAWEWQCDCGTRCQFPSAEVQQEVHTSCERCSRRRAINVIVEEALTALFQGFQNTKNKEFDSFDTEGVERKTL